MKKRLDYEFNEITSHTVVNELKSLNTIKAPGWDAIFPKIV